MENTKTTFILFSKFPLQNYKNEHSTFPTPFTSECLIASINQSPSILIKFHHLVFPHLTHKHSHTNTHTHPTS